MRFRSLHIASAIFLTMLCRAQTGSHNAANFPPLEQWKSAIIAGSPTALASLYSASPPAQIATSSAQISASSDVSFWIGLAAKTIKLARSRDPLPQPGLQQICTFSAQIRTAPPGSTSYVAAGQLWQRTGPSWKLVSIKRTDATKLEQPLSLDDKIYPPPAMPVRRMAAPRLALRKPENVSSGLRRRLVLRLSRSGKGFHRPDIAAVLTSNYELVNVDVGQGDRNQDLMNQYDVPMKRGIPGPRCPRLQRQAALQPEKRRI